MSRQNLIVVAARLFLLLVLILLIWLMASNSPKPDKTDTSVPPPVSAESFEALDTSKASTTEGASLPKPVLLFEAENGCSYVVIPGGSGKPDTLVHSELCPRCSSLKQ